MKKLFVIIVLMALAMNGIAQILNYDFSAECETGQTLYYRISSEEEHTVTLTFPYSTENPWFEGNYYQYHVMPQGELILPSTVTNNGINYYVTVIDNYAFCNCEELTGTLAIPEGIVSIGESAFFSCGFSSFIIPRTINYIDPSAFRFCSNRDFVVVDDNNLTYYSENNAIIQRDENTLVLACNTTTIPVYIENIGDYAFSGVGNGGDLIIPNSVKSIGERAFESCHFLGSLILSESLETIGYEAFRGSGLTGSLTIPNSVTEIGAGAFLDVSFTGTLTLPSSISSIKGHTFAYTSFSGTLTIPNSVTQIGSRAFYGADFSELVLGSSIDTIGVGAFEDCSSLSGTLHLPSSINSIGTGAFRHTSFSELYSHNIVPPTLINSSTFGGYDTNTPIHIPFGTTNAYQNAEGWNYFTNFIEEEPIIYIDYEPDTCKFITSSPESDFMFDIDHDGTVDMTLSGYTQHGAVLVHIAMSNGFQLCRSNENTILNADTINWFHNDDLSNGFPLDSYRKRYGFRKTEDGHHFFGWMEIYWDGIFVPEGKMIYLDRMAFCTIPDYPLRWGQTSIESFLLDNTEWYYEIQNDDGSITYQHLKAEGDTTIHEKRPKIIIRSNTQYDRDEITEVTHEYIYEEDGIVYWWNKNLEEFTILYNLNADVGDEWEIKVGMESLTMHVDAVENYEYEDKFYRILSVSDENDLFSGNIVCGIGHLTSFFPEKLMNQDKGYRVEGLRCYWVNDELVFKYGDKDCDAVYTELHNGIEEDGPSTGSEAFTVYPNPANGILTVSVRLPQCDNPTTGQTEYQISNLMGQTLLQGRISAETQQIDISTLPAGMYFINVGKQTEKFVVR